MIPETLPIKADASVSTIADPETATKFVKPVPAHNKSPKKLRKALAKTPARNENATSLLRSIALLQDHRQIESSQDHKEGNDSEQASERDLDPRRRSGLQDPSP